MTKKLPTQLSLYPDTFYRVSQKAVIRDANGKILVNKEGNSDNWSLPGGGWDHGESEQQSLARELLEEINYHGDFTATPIKTATFWMANKSAWLLWIVYDVQTENSNFSIGKDSSDIAFIDPKTLKDSTSLEEQWIYKNF